MLIYKIDQLQQILKVSNVLNSVKIESTHLNLSQLFQQLQKYETMVTQYINEIK